MTRIAVLTVNKKMPLTVGRAVTLMMKRIADLRGVRMKTKLRMAQKKATHQMRTAKMRVTLRAMLRNEHPTVMQSVSAISHSHSQMNQQDPDSKCQQATQPVTKAMLNHPMGRKVDQMKKALVVMSQGHKMRKAQVMTTQKLTMTGRPAQAKALKTNNKLKLFKLLECQKSIQICLLWQVNRESLP
jgi:hypothetical protein